MFHGELEGTGYEILEKRLDEPKNSTDSTVAMYSIDKPRRSDSHGIASMDSTGHFDMVGQLKSFFKLN